MGVRTGLFAIALLSPVLVTAGSETVHANDSPAPSQHVAVSLIAETRNIVPGQPFHLALRQQIEPGWHTYWMNPGDSGLPTEIVWTLPPGFKAGPILWPQPKRIAYGPVVDYGYENEIVLPIDIDVPATLTPAANVVIEAHASWLVCFDTCIPEDAQLNISVPVGVHTELDPRWVERFEHARSQLPLANPFPTTASINGENITLQIAIGDAQKLRELMFFPEDRSVIDDDAPQISAMGSAGLTLTLQRSNKAKPPPAMLRGVLAFRDSAAQSDVGTEAIAISTPIQPHMAAVSVERSFVWALVLAFAGGVLLNLMPCVLPVLSIKAFGLVQHAQSGSGAARAQGIAYTIGVMASFAAIAAILLGVRAAGTEIGWGFQLQSPLFVALMIYVMFAVGLNLSGVFSVGERIAGVAGEISSESYSGSFLTGALATLVATPCTAPFMAAALGYAITQPWYRSLAIFEAVGLGMSFPYLAIAFSPSLRRFLPRPGAWMLTLKQFLAFPIYGTAVWLTFILAQESGDLAVTAILAGLVLIALAAWLYESLRLSARRWRRLGIAGSAIALFGALAVLPLADADQAHNTQATEAKTGIDWLPFNLAKVDDLQAQGRPVFVDFTADWCITCKLNERTALADPAVIKAFASNEVAALRADWTRQDQSITRALEANGRAGVPLYLFYPRPGPGGERRGPVVLPQLLTAATILHEMQIQ